MIRISYAPDAWRLLEGLFCVYKPDQMSMRAMKQRILGNICRDLNAMEVRPPENFVKIEDDPTSETGIVVTNVPSFADNPMVVGARYQMQDLKIAWPCFHAANTSGLSVLGINCGRVVNRLANAKYVNSFHISGRFGIATDNFHSSGRLLEKTTYSHIRQFKLDHLLASMQAAHQRHMFSYMGVDIQSQEAYELASKGLVRPEKSSAPLLYGIKCIDLQLPEFTLEVQCINETESYLMELIHELGLSLKSTATCTKLRQIRFGPFDLEVALLRKHWTVSDIISNIAACQKLLDVSKLQPSEANLMTEIKPDSSEVRKLSHRK